MLRLSTVIFLSCTQSSSQRIAINFTDRAGVFLVQLFVNNDDIQVRKLTSCHRLRVAPRRMEELYIHPKTGCHIAFAKCALRLANTLGLFALRLHSRQFVYLYFFPNFFFYPCLHFLKHVFYFSSPKIWKHFTNLSEMRNIIPVRTCEPRNFELKSFAGLPPRDWFSLEH